MLFARRAIAAAVALLYLGTGAPALASDGLPLAVGDPVTLFARFPFSAPAAVNVTARLFDPAGPSFDSLGSHAATKLANGFETWYVPLSDLDDTSGLPAPGDCTEQYLLLLWTPDAANCTTTPSSCIVEVYSLGGETCRHTLQKQSDSFVFASAPVLEQGITQAVLDYYGKRGQLPIRWRQLKLGGLVEDAPSVDERVLYEVYRYTSETDPPRLNCVVTTENDPNVALPSFGQCAGN